MDAEEDDEAPKQIIEEILVTAARLKEAINSFPPLPVNSVEFENILIVSPYLGHAISVRFPKTPGAGHYAGRCDVPLEILEFANFKTTTLRHDNLESFEVKDSFFGRTQERSSGFYAVSFGQAVDAATEYILDDEIIMVPGYHSHRSTSTLTCVPTKVTEQEF